MRKLTIAAGLLGLFAVSSFAATVSFTALLDGPSESPAVASAGTGTALVIFDTTAKTMQVITSFSGLTGNVTAAHIHCCTAVAGAGNVGVASVTPTFTGFPSGATFGSYDHTFDTSVTSGTFNAAFVTANGGTAAGAEAALIAGAQAGKAYLNIHSSAFGGGEIRGFLVETPEPGTFLLGGAALGLVAMLRRRSVATL